MKDRLASVFAACGSGFAAAVQPVSATTVTTGIAGLDAGDLEIPAGDIEVPAYRAIPEKGRDHPVALVVEEIFGLHEHIKDVCRRLAKAGYLAVAPELFVRQGDASKLESKQDIMSKVVSRVPDSQVLSDLDATVTWAAKNHGDISKLVITGFCWGGRIAWLYAAHNPELKAAAAWYGRLTGPIDSHHPRHPIDVVSQLKAPVLGLYGGKDESIPPDTVDNMREALKAAGRKADIIIYPDAGHAFNADYRPSYHPSSATDAWARMLSWFHQHGA